MLDITQYHIFNNWQRYEDFRLKKKTGLPTGFTHIDKSVRALPGITTLVGSTGLGKSYFTMNIFLNIALKGIPVILIDKEIGFVDVRTRIICYLSGLTEPAVTSGKFVNDEEERYLEAIETLKELPLYYFDDIKREEVEEYVKLAGRYHSSRVFLVVDSLNRLITDFDNRRGDVDAWITLFNNLKLKYDNYLNIWLICEKNKQGDVKESNTIEFISELWLDMSPSRDGDSLIIDCKKQRNGPKGILTQLIPSTPFCYRLEEVAELFND